MVGVAGRSKGCRNCRRKKKGCDLQKPQCGQCQRSRVICEGYERDLIIVQYVADNSLPPSLTSRSPASKCSGAQNVTQLGDSLSPVPMLDTWTVDFSCVPSGMFIHQMLAASDMSDPISTSAGPLQVYPASPRSLADGDLLNSMSEFQLIQGLWDVSYPLIHPRLDIGGLNMGYWRPAVEALFDRSLAVKHGLLAVAFTDAARRSGIGSWAIEAMKHYTIALGDINRALSDPERQTSDAVLAACKLLSLYESGGGSSNAGQWSGSQGGSNWDNHVVGECKVLRMRGPESLAGDAFLLFTDLRMLAVAYGFKKRKRIFFEDEEWQTLPFEGHTKDIRQLLVDNAVQHSGLHEEIDSLRALLRDSVASASRQRQYFDLIVEKLVTLREGLVNWWDLVQRIVPPRVIHSIEQGIPETFNPMDQGFAHTMCFYWTMIMSIAFSTCQVHQFAQVHPELLRRNSSVSSSASPEPTTSSQTSYNLLPSLEEASAEAHFQALRIASSTSYFFQPSAGVYGSTAFSFPMSIAINYFAVTHNTSSPAFTTLLRAFEQPSAVAPVVKNFVISGQRAMNSASADAPNDEERDGEVWFGVHGVGGEVVVF